LPAQHHENYRLLTPEERSRIDTMIPLLRLADGLDIGREQRVKDIYVQIGNASVELYLEASSDVELEQWAAQQVGTVFEQLFGRSLTVLRAPDES
jgi:exopolyphosphatase/guanosine-5'-triphosphate,3'-diphosphate pyrophosphatase